MLDGTVFNPVKHNKGLGCKSHLPSTLCQVDGGSSDSFSFLEEILEWPTVHFSDSLAQVAAEFKHGSSQALVNEVAW